MDNNTFEKRKIALDTLENISKEWDIEAKQEDSKFFYSFDIINKIKRGDTRYVIGRKGMGKTAISEYLANNHSNMEFTCRLSFKNFPFNYLYSLEDLNYRKPNQYISIWKYVIYNSICKMMANNEGIDNSITQKLQELYLSTSPTEKTLSKIIKKWTTTGFGFQILGSGITVNGERLEFSSDSNWCEKTNILEKIICEYGGNYKYYILIDELDEDYTTFSSEKEKQQYFQLITSLIKAIQLIKTELSEIEGSFIPVVFLRNDIYSQIKDADKNKWREHISELSWNSQELKKMLCKRLCISSNNRLSENTVWNILFSSDPVYMGNRQKNSMPIFDYITRSTHLRPRDYIFYIKKCAEKAIEKGDTYIKGQTVKEVDRVFSEYLKSEIIDEIFVEIPNYSDVFSILSQIRKQTFSPDLFISNYSKLPNQNEETAKELLIKLFNFGIIGNQPSMKGQQIFKYQYPDALFNYTESLIIHRGLYKALQIF